MHGVASCECYKIMPWRSPIAAVRIPELSKSLRHEDVARDGGAGVGADDFRVPGGADLCRKSADGRHVAAPVEAAGAEEAAVELLKEDGAEGGADGGARSLGFTEESEPQVGCLCLNLHAIQTLR